MLPFHHPNIIESGCDEAGRGCLAGAVYAAAVILPKDFHHPWLNDSKQVTEKQRDVLRQVIESEAQYWAVGAISPEEIDRINILRASFAAMHKALDQLPVPPAFILVDGNRFVPYRNIPHACIIKGDGKYASIAAASILAKTYRDEAMLALDSQFPEYGWRINKGYPTKAHRDAIRQYGITPHHRRTFRLLPLGEQLSFF
jgi:ribonuclease HII